MNQNIALDFKKKFKSSLDNKNYNEFIALERSYHVTCIKKIETPDHYNNCYEIINPFLELYGEIILTTLNITSEDRKKDVNKICYFMPDLDNDLAHIELFACIIEHHKFNDNIKIYIAGYSKFPEIQSSLLKKLQQQNKITIINSLLNYKTLHNSLLTLVKFIFENKISKFIVFSTPFHLYAFLKIFGSEDLKWITTRFELNCFKKLKYLISFNNSNKFLNLINSNWIRLPATLPSKYRFIYTPIKKNELINLLTIGRNPKIEDINFLNCVSSILTSNKNTLFTICGMKNNEFIENFFEEKNLRSRIKFHGWVTPIDTLKQYDMYLDTPQSGFIASSAFSSGMPTLQFRNSNSFLESYEASISIFLKEKDININCLELFISSNSESYISSANKLITDYILREKISSIQVEIGNNFFYNSFDTYKNLIAYSIK